MLPNNVHQDLKGRYAKLVCNPDIWIQTARRLLASSKLLELEITRRWEDMDFRKPKGQRYTIQDGLDVSDFHFPYMMLIGFALENVFKSHLVKRHKIAFLEQIQQSGDFPRMLKTHDLRKLAKSCSIDTSQSFAHLLDRLTKHSVWRGRYQFPTDYKTFYHLSAESTTFSSGVALSSNDIQTMNEAVEFVCNSLKVKL